MSVFDTFARPPCAETLGWQLIEADPETGTVRVAMEGKPAFCNPGGNIQGGFLAAMLDDTLGPTVLVKSGGAHYCATIDLNVSYLAPARPGLFTGVGRIVQMGKTIAFLEGELFDAEGGCVARATASARVVPTTNVARA
ncbi:PaaI family thioesterase [Sphingomonas sp. ERG5]|uniref:PaaI family thioesterase n=1 Tax=Sphingomonas sp. ERG5 TaxID=1381597 RepID=UPI00054BC03B|nr:PaaI family thioesterase [Sphingomonas sp. ERG5]